MHSYLTNTWEKTWQVEGVEYIEQYHMKFVKKSHHLKRRGRKLKRSYSLCFRSQFAFQSTVFCALSPISFFCPVEFFIFFLIKEDNMYTIIVR